VETNYTKYRGGPSSNGKGKLYWASLISEEIKDAGVRKYRSSKAIKNKISSLEDSFKSAHDWAGQTGAGVREEDPRNFNDYILKKCPYYFDLLPVMEDRSNSRPQVTTDDVDLSSDSNEDDEEEKEEPNDTAKSAGRNTNSQKRNEPRKNDTAIAVTTMQKEAIAEVSRHNLEMEAIRKREMECFVEDHQQKLKMARINEHVALIEAYDKIKGKVSDDFIRKKIPELAEYIEDKPKKKQSYDSDASAESSVSLA
jgi:hypothetical protein